MHRFLCPDLSAGFLSREESHHAAVVLRMKEGDACSLFNGKGGEAKAVLTRVQKNKTEYRTLSIQQSSDAAYRLILGQAIPKGKAMDLILQKATELGLQEIYPLASDHSVVQLDEDRIESKLNKWKQTLVEACKQCGQNTLPVLHPVSKIQDFLDAHQASKGLKLIGSLQPDARPLGQVLEESKKAGPLKEVVFLVGPEGDFTPSEIGKARSAGYVPVTLGPQVLRTETASIYLISVLSYELS